VRREDFPIVDGLVKKITTEARRTRRNTRKNLVKLCDLCALVVKKINHNRHSRTHSFSFPTVPYVPIVVNSSLLDNQFHKTVFISFGYFKKIQPSRPSRKVNFSVSR